ncbi:MAG: MetQ/NlpA family ABC transporter substrate-binding protein [Clostridiales Family XIII bacterium]|nr:MetQ/NlpA family ABC transporter substrate-binding protein [Clostridiales Family XIII bacterium]
MKKKTIIVALIVLALAFAGLSACGKDKDDSAGADEGGAKENVTITVGASPTPHAEILNEVVSDLAEQGITLKVQEFTDYVLPNTALDEGELDANYFQHTPYLDEFNAEKGTKIVSIAPIHYEPFGVYPGKSKSLADIQDGAKIAVPNDATNEARALLLLEANGLIKLKDGVGLAATKNDIAENAKNIDIVEIEAAQLPKSLPDVDFAVINGNYALEAGLNAADDALAVEAQDSLAAETFANIIAIREGDENRPELQALVKALQSDKVKAFIEKNYKGAVVPVF